MQVPEGSEVRNVIIIGSGPAGYTAGIYTARAGLKPLLFEGSVTAGGALMNTTEVENFPGFPDGIMGPDLMDGLRKQAERFGADLVTDDITEVELDGPIKRVVDGNGDAHFAKTVIIATGSGYRELGLDDEKRLSDRYETRVTVNVGGRIGKVIVEFGSIEDLDRILEMIAPGERVRATE